MMKGNHDRMEVSYNGQIAVEADSKLIVAYDVDNKASDHHQLASMAEQAQAALRRSSLRAVADRGYYDGEQVRRCIARDITPYVPEPEKGRGAAERTAMAPEFQRDRFVYDPTTDTVRCPAGARLTFRGSVGPIGTSAGGSRARISDGPVSFLSALHDTVHPQSDGDDGSID